MQIFEFFITLLVLSIICFFLSKKSKDKEISNAFIFYIVYRYLSYLWLYLNSTLKIFPINIFFHIFLPFIISIIIAYIYWWKKTKKKTAKYFIAYVVFFTLFGSNFLLGVGIPLIITFFSVFGKKNKDKYIKSREEQSNKVILQKKNSQKSTKEIFLEALNKRVLTEK